MINYSFIFLTWKFLFVDFPQTFFRFHPNSNSLLYHSLTSYKLLTIHRSSIFIRKDMYQYVSRSLYCTCISHSFNIIYQLSDYNLVVFLHLFNKIFLFLTFLWNEFGETKILFSIQAKSLLPLLSNNDDGYPDPN